MILPNGLEITGPGGINAKLGGPLIIVSVFALVVLGGLGWGGLQVFKANSTEHQMLRRSQDLTTCAVMIPPDWRDVARRSITKRSQFTDYCPWLKDD